MKDEALNLEEIEASHTRWSRGSRQGRGRGEGVAATLLSYTLRYINLADFVDDGQRIKKDQNHFATKKS